MWAPSDARLNNFNALDNIRDTSGTWRFWGEIGLSIVGVPEFEVGEALRFRRAPRRQSVNWRQKYG